MGSQYKSVNRLFGEAFPVIGLASRRTPKVRSIGVDQTPNNAHGTTSSFNPKPEAMAGATCGRSIPLPAIAFGFGLNELRQNEKVVSRAMQRNGIMDVKIRFCAA
jgi:hypothetical protein